MLGWAIAIQCGALLVAGIIFGSVAEAATGAARFSFVVFLLLYLFSLIVPQLRLLAWSLTKSQPRKQGIGK